MGWASLAASFARQKLANDSPFLVRQITSRQGSLLKGSLESRLSPSVNPLCQQVLSKSQYVEPIFLLLRAGLYSGLRPCEWKHAALQYDIEAGAWTLTVVNGKCSNGRSHGATRTLLWKERGREFEAVEKWIAYLERTLPKNAVDRDTEWDRLYKAWGRQLHSVAERLWPRRERRICFYTARHMFAAEAKKSSRALKWRRCWGMRLTQPPLCIMLVPRDPVREMSFLLFQSRIQPKGRGCVWPAPIRWSGPNLMHNGLVGDV